MSLSGSPSRPAPPELSPVSCSTESNKGGAKPSGQPTVRRNWSILEDQALIAAVARHGSSRGPGSGWSKISAAVGEGRTNKDCRKRWFHSLDPGVRKGKWSEREDDTLRALYAELGPKWKEIALRIPGRKDDQVSKRWRNVLAPELTPCKAWTVEEDAHLLTLLERWGSRWTAIANDLPGRSPIMCRNRARRYGAISITGRQAGTADASSTGGASAEESDTASRRSKAQDDQSMGEENAVFGLRGFDLPPLGVSDLDAMLGWSPTMPSIAPFGMGGFESQPALGASGQGQPPEAQQPLLSNMQHSDFPVSDDNIMTWLSSFGPNGLPAMTAHVHQGPRQFDVPPPAPPLSVSQPAISSSAPVRSPGTQPVVTNAWSLLVMLETGADSVHVSTDFVRQLLADAARVDRN